jgi:hypothetical protein
MSNRACCHREHWQPAAFFPIDRISQFGEEFRHLQQKKKDVKEFAAHR